LKISRPDKTQVLAGRNASDFICAEDMMLNGQIALVTGANGGTGFEVVRALARKGMTVYLGSRDAEKGQRAVEQLAGEGDVRLALIDLTDEKTLETAVAMIDEAHGRLDSLVNNAGFAPDGTILDALPESVRESMEANLHGPIRLAQLALPLLRKAEVGRIVNVSSMTSLIRWIQAPDSRVRPETLPYAYSVAKAAQNAATIMLAHALQAQGIKVNAGTPGYVKSQVSRFMGTKPPEEGARIIIELATLDKDGPTCGFFDDNGPIAWT
jgi:NAD(P)-dependent dehydrogenase (short-subunit alcohol dehydrogenase family)